jgi:1,2-phenylacetyl-CoA epoxidase PaaB subunit
MPQANKVDRLPTDLKDELNQRLIAQAFSGYVELEEWLAGQGYQISKSAIHRHGQEFKKRLESISIAVSQAKAIAEATGDDANALAEALTQLAQQKTFDALVNYESEENIPLPKLIRAVSDLNKSSIAVKQYREKIKEKTESAAQEIEKFAKTKGLSAETADAIRKQILGIVE